jgi:transposase InsO family protein
MPPALDQPVGLLLRAGAENGATLALMAVIDQVFMDCPWYGSRQMARHLQRMGHAVGRRRVRRLMAKMGLAAIYQRPRTSDPHPEHRIYPYLLRDLAITRPNQVWCADVTYLPMRRGFLYLVAIMDWATRKVLAWRISNDGRRVLRRALEDAMARHGKPEIFNYRSGQPIHQPRLHPRAAGGRSADQHGWRGALDGQRLHRAPVAIREIRVRLSPRF